MRSPSTPLPTARRRAAGSTRHRAPSIRKWEVDLDAVLAGVRRVADDDAGHVEGAPASVVVDRHRPERRAERRRAGDGNRADRREVGRAGDDDPAHQPPRRSQRGVRRRGDRAGAAVAGVGSDDRLRRTRIGSRPPGPGRAGTGRCGAGSRDRRVEAAGHGRPAHVGCSLRRPPAQPHRLAPGAPRAGWPAVAPGDLRAAEAAPTVVREVVGTERRTSRAPPPACRSRGSTCCHPPCRARCPCTRTAARGGGRCHEPG